MSDTQTDDAYATFVADMESDASVLGLLLTGSRAVGRQTAASDWDVVIIVNDQRDPEERAAWSAGVLDRHAVLDLDLTNGGVQTLAEFEDFAEPDTVYYWERYDLAHARLVFDRTGGTVRALLESKRTLPASDAATILHGSLGLPHRLSLFVEAAYRSVRSGEGGRAFEALVDAGRAVQHGVPCLFALHGRVAPYPKYLGWELEQHPLADLSWPSGLLIERLTAIMTTADAASIRDLFWEVERLARLRDAAGAFDAWGGGKLLTTMAPASNPVR